MEPLITSITNALSSLPDVRVCRIEYDPSAMDSGADLEITLEVQGRLLRLLVDQRKNAYPRDVRAVIEPLLSLPTQCGGIPAIPMLIAPAIPESSRALLRIQRIAYGDGSGSLYLPFLGNLLYVDRPVPRGSVRESLNIYKGNTNRVLHILLAEPHQSWHVNELAGKAGVSPSTVHQVLRVLESQLWMESHGKGPARVRVLREPGALLDAWREEHSLKQYEVQTFYGWSKSGEELRTTVATALEAVGRGYALTLSSGALLVAPFVTGVEKISVLVPSDVVLDSVWAAAGLQPVDEGANVTVLRTKGDAALLLRRQVKNVWVASDIQLYLDLWASPTRGKEQAEHLRRERIKF